MSLRNLPKHQRPREKLLSQGVNSLTDAQLLAILLRTGYKGKSAVQLAQQLLRRYSLAELIEIEPKQLAKIKGVGQSRAAMIAAAVAICNRVDLPQRSLVDPPTVATFLSDISKAKQEILVGLYLNARYELIRQIEIFKGTIDTSLIHPREIFAYALELRASAIIIAHNHPSGNKQPSNHDLKTTEKLVSAGRILDIPIVDHLILTSQEYYSFRENGQLDSPILD